MVWAGVTSDGRTPPVFIPQEVKINHMVYRETILESILKPWAQNILKVDPGPFNRSQHQLTRPEQLKIGE